MPSSSALMRKIFAKLGVSCVVASSGKEAVDRFSVGAFDIVFMDLQMPEMDGFETTMEMRRLESASNASRRTPIVALTAQWLTGDSSECVEAGMDGVIRKPVKMAEVASAIRQHCYKYTALG